MAEGNNSIPGKKVFFLNPSALIQNQLVAELAQDEFEVYIVRNEVKFARVLKKYPGSVVFVNMNDGTREEAREKWIRGIMGADETAGTGIGILSSGVDENIRRKYVEQLKIRCGYTVLKSDLPGVIKTVTDILNGVNAKGRRKYLRMMMDEGANTTVNFPMNGTFVNGFIRDISVVGFSCSLPDDPEIVKNSFFADIQLRLQTQLLKAEGIFFGSREEDGKKIYVILFTQRISPDVRTRIRKYIQSSLQTKMDSELK